MEAADAVSDAGGANAVSGGEGGRGDDAPLTSGTPANGGTPAVAAPPAEPSPDVKPAESRTRLKRAPLAYQSLGVIVVGMSLAVWWPAFTLGAWGTIFFDTVLRIWVAATAAFIVVTLLPAARRRIGWQSLTLLLPTLWLILNFAVDDESGNLWEALLSLAGVLIIVIGVPSMIWVLAKVVWPDIGERVPARGKLLVLATVLVIAAGSFVLGANESRFLTCEDFTISGNSEPPGCVHEAPDSTTSPADVVSPTP